MEIAQPRPAGLLLKLRGNHSSGMSLGARELASGAEALLEVEGVDDGLAASSSGPAQWVRIDASDNPWDQAHAMMRAGFAVGSGDLLAAEPDFEQHWVPPPSQTQCVAERQTAAGGRAVGPHDRWHLDAAFSALGQARDTVTTTDLARVLIAHLDTGYDPGHQFRPAHIAPGERSFVAGDADPNRAVDVTRPGGALRSYGHGTGTIGILAGPQIGGAPAAQVLPIRIADGVVRFRTGSIAQGFDYALKSGAHLLSMSMGGLASAIVADAVNKCYDHGLVMVTAAGNNFSGLPVRSIVYPARMRRVVAACGMMADGQPYAQLSMGTMEGCYGPASKMRTAMCGFTPNIPWPEIGCGNVVDEDGQGTSAATPQVAAAAALWIAANWQAHQGYGETWMRGEAVRQALFRSASLGGRANPDPKLGWGCVRAMALLQQAPLAAAALSPEPRASAAWAWLKLLSGEGTGFAPLALIEAERLLGLELMQLAQRDPAVGGALADPEAASVPRTARRTFLEAAEASKLASKVLKAAIGRSLAGRRRAPLPAAPPRTAPATATTKPSSVAPPARRRLRIYALDPSLGGALNAFEDQVAAISIRNEPDLKPGPVGEYLEVVDVDPASNRFYPPVDLNDTNILKEEDGGLKPSEGKPMFHQQMVYAVAMRTIEQFEVALGRKAFWAPHWSGKTGDPNHFVPRLRIYPHALRQENAYYSPDKKALLFGYFPARSKITDLTPPGTMVFSCLSADIIAHETTHALLDGQARTMRDPSNPDVRAFHEAFADIVALFQQYTYSDLVRREIARTRGELSAATFLGGLAVQFGEGTDLSGPLRRYSDVDRAFDYTNTFKTHERGAILVAAIYRAFLAIVERRTADLVRLATGGTGVLPAGAIHPDLVERLAQETTKAARHVLRMCIRAIDYCPPVDITFGEYLRAIVTADLVEFPDDRYNYRVAFLEAFRRLQLLPRNLRTVSDDTLCWRGWEGEQPHWLAGAISALNLDPARVLDREAQFYKDEEDRATLRKAILAGLRSQADCDPLGLQYRLPYYSSLGAKGYQSSTTFMVESLRLARRLRDDGSFAAQLMVVVRQSRPELLGDSEAGGDASRFWFRGGVRLVIDLLEPAGPKIRHAIRKPIVSPTRLARERRYRLGEPVEPLRATYFSGDRFADQEPFAMIHADRDAPWLS